MRKAFRLLAMLLLTLLAACRPDEPGIDDYKPPDTPVAEILITDDDGYMLYVSNREFNGIVNPTIDYLNNLVTKSIYRIPNHRDAQLIRHRKFESSARWICCKGDTICSFNPDGTGNISQIGTKKAYTLRPVRSVEPMDTIHINLSNY